jgi:hypothetical protein
MRVWLLSLPVALAVGVCPMSGRADSGAQALLAKAIKAHGGDKALTRYTALRLKLKRTDEPTRFTYRHVWLFASPDQFKDVGDGYYLMRRITTIYATDGKSAWSHVQGRTEQLDAKSAEWYHDEAHLMQVMRLVPLKNPKYELKATGETIVDGKPALGLLVRTRKQKDVSLFFDARTGLLVKLERLAYDYETEMEAREERFYRNYPKKAPLPYARRIDVKLGGKYVAHYDVGEVKFLEKVAAREFRPPQ